VEGIRRPRVNQYVAKDIAVRQCLRRIEGSYIADLR
jgi:hypothetical protein